MSPYRTPGATDDTTPDERIGPKSKCLATCPRCGVMLLADTPTGIGNALLEHAKVCGRPEEDHYFVRIVDAFETEGLGPHILRIETPGRSTGVTVRFVELPEGVEATVICRAELTPDECSSMVAWCRSRWRAPARVVGVAFQFG